MHKVALFGAGKIGETITALLASSDKYKIKVCDQDGARAKRIAALWPNTEAHTIDLNDAALTEKTLSDCDAVINALPYQCNPMVAPAAVKTGTHYLDLTEDVESTEMVLSLAEKTKVCLIPQCGLAPGFVSIAAAHLTKSFDKLDTVKMRVGALPLYPSNYLKYNLTWSTDGLINEYGNMSRVIDNYELKSAFPLEGYETFSLDGDQYEAFNTSGGLGTLWKTLEGKVRKLDYKSVRYPGHRDFIAFLMNELRFNEDRETLKRVLERSISATTQDKCLILVEVQGQEKDRLIQKTYASTVYNTFVNDKHFGAIQITTASGICTPLDLLLSGKLPRKSGVIRCEEISLTDFLASPFGQYYKDEKAMKGISQKN